MDKQPAFDLFGTFVHMKANGARSPVEVNEAFWKESMAGERKDLNEGLTGGFSKFSAFCCNLNLK